MRRRGRYGLLLTAVVLALLIPIGAGQETRIGGDIRIGQNETTGDMIVTAGSATISGTVDGNLTASAGTVTLDGTVTRDAMLVGGTVTVTGAVDRHLRAIGETVVIGEQATIGGDADIAGENVTVDGTVGGDLRAETDTLRIGPSAVIEGNVTHSADDVSIAEDAEIAGSVTQQDQVELDMPFPVYTDIPAWAFALYGFLANLALGIVLLLVVPDRSIAVADRIVDRPGTTFFVGFLVLFLVPLLLVLLAATIIGFPLAIVGVFGFFLLLWLASVYGSFALGAALLSVFDIRNRWIWLVAGLLLVFGLGTVPVLGTIVYITVILLGLGGIITGRR